MPGTAVIVPFFQRSPGLLRSAVQSALAQQDAGPVTVIVCDDASPIPAETELAALDPALRRQVIVLHQPNSGAGAARNRALDAVPDDTTWIAFLDSDDRWRPTHLARAIAALQADHDLLFADARRDHEAQSHFQRAGFEPRNHTPITQMEGLYAFAGDFLTENIKMSPVSISTVVMRASTLGRQRFQPIAVEDLMFWFEIARQRPRVAFDATLQVDYGVGGITVTGSWTSPAELRMCLMYQKIFKRVAQDFPLTAQQAALLGDRMARNRRLFAAVMLGQLRRGQIPAWRFVRQFLSIDAKLPIAVMAAMANKVQTAIR